MKKILDDDREIVALTDRFGRTVAAVGKEGVTKIEAYGEPAYYGSVPWIAVYTADTILFRAPAGQVTIHYVFPEDR